MNRDLPIENIEYIKPVRLVKSQRTQEYHQLASQINALLTEHPSSIEGGGLLLLLASRPYF